MKGLTIRDMIAIEAMKSLMAEAETINEFRGMEFVDGTPWQYGLSSEAYAIADAMLKEREKK